MKLISFILLFLCFFNIQCKKETPTGPVFTCGLHQGDIISFQLEPSVPAQNCAICLIADAVPPKANDVTNVRKVK
jgi:hypothetical protein